MRQDIAARYRDLRSNPQRIVYSTIPLADRTDFLPARPDSDDSVRPVVYDADGFSVDDEESTGDDTSFALQDPVSRRSGDDDKRAVSGPDKPRSTTPPSDTTPAAGDNASAGSPAARSSRTNEAPAPGDDDLLSIAMQEEREGKRRRSERLAERQKKQMLVPCSCGAWIRVLEDQAGRTVRCRQCKQPLQIPEIKRKSDKKDDKPAPPKLNVTWIDDVWFHSVVPTSLVLKPGSLADKHTVADLALTETGLHVVTFGGGDKKKKAGLSFGSAKKPDVAAARKAVRDHVAATGELKNLPDAELKSLDAADLRLIKLVQPIVKAHESMFAGVPVFGEGRIAVFLPIAAADGQQTFCSFAISTWRVIAERLKSLFSIELPTSENGVPDADKTETVSCFINQSKVEAVKNSIYYQKDPAFELELSGHRCKACNVVISEDGRKKNKLGGANGKGIAKAKCPKCSKPMGDEPLFRIKKSPAPVAD